ncbi:MAG: class I SAM-dependent methyltransferase [Verrucomicrobiota bacterium]|nr:class I SAM-dependent methyltransferase [Verrucomicrobiota bacterium]
MSRGSRAYRSRPSHARLHAPGFIQTPHPLRNAVRRVIGAPNFLRRLQFRPTLELLLPVSNGPIRLLEIGCGQGWMSLEAAGVGFDTVGIDPQGHSGWPSLQHGKVRFLRADGTQLPFAGGAFDRVLMLSVVQMLPDPLALLRECGRVLADSPAARLIFSVPGPYPHLLESMPAEELRELMRSLFHTPGRIWYDREELEVLLQQGNFRIVECRQSPGPTAARVWQQALIQALKAGREPSLKALFYRHYPRLWWDRGSECGSHTPGWGGEWLIAAEPVR